VQRPYLQGWRLTDGVSATQQADENRTLQGQASALAAMQREHEEAELRAAEKRLASERNLAACMAHTAAGWAAEPHMRATCGDLTPYGPGPYGRRATAAAHAQELAKHNVEKAELERQLAEAAVEAAATRARQSKQQDQVREIALQCTWAVGLLVLHGLGDGFVCGT
jgi:hypothetical protein